MEVTRPEILLKNTGEPQAAISRSMAKLNFGRANFRSASPRIKGIMAIMAQPDIDRDTASAEPTTSIWQTSSRKASRPMVTRFEPTLMIMLVLTKPLMRRKLSAAKKRVASGPQRAQVRRYLTEVTSNSPSAPIIRASGSAAKNMMLPISTAARKIIMTAQEKTLFAVSWSPFPSAMDIGAEAPTPIRSAREKLIITSGMAILMAAKALSPRVWPMNMPSTMLYRDIANMLIMPGIATTKNSRHGFIAAYISSVGVLITDFSPS